MSHFVDPGETVTVPLGSCQCPGTPHPDGDQAIVLRELPYAAEGLIGNAGWRAGDGVRYDFTAARLKLLELGVVSWNLLGPKGEPMPAAPESYARLRREIVDALAAGINASNEGKAKLPNAPGARSPNGSPASASRTRESRAPTSSTIS